MSSSSEKELQLSADNDDVIFVDSYIDLTRDESSMEHDQVFASGASDADHESLKTLITHLNIVMRELNTIKFKLYQMMVSWILMPKIFL